MTIEVIENTETGNRTDSPIPFDPSSHMEGAPQNPSLGIPGMATSTTTLISTDPESTEALRKAALRGLINGAGNMLVGLAVAAAFLGPIIETLKITFETTAEVPIIAEYPILLISVTLLVTSLLIINAIRNAIKYPKKGTQDKKNEELDAEWRDIRTAINAAAINSALVYTLLFPILQAVMPDPTGFLPSIIAGSVAIVVGALAFVFNKRNLDTFLGKKEHVTEAQRLASASRWGIANGVGFAGNITLLISLGYFAAKALTAVIMGTSIASSLPLSTIGIVITLALFGTLTIAFAARNAYLYKDIERKKIAWEKAVVELENLPANALNREEIQAKVDNAEKAYKTANETAADFRKHRLVFGTALATFAITLSIGLSLAALASPIPPLAIALVCLTLVVATAAAVYVAYKGAKAYKDDPKATVMSTLWECVKGAVYQSSPPSSEKKPEEIVTTTVEDKPKEALTVPSPDVSPVPM